MKSRCNDWPWSAISTMASHLLSSVTPLQLPEDDDEHPVKIALSNFIEQLLSPNDGKEPFCRAPIRSIVLGEDELGLFEFVILLVTLDDLEYYVHMRHPKDEESLWHHHISFLWSYHGLVQDTVVIYRPGEMERAAREGLDITLKVEVSGGDTAASQNIRSFALRLRELRDNYWWFYLLNQDWRWPTYIVKTTIKCVGQTVRVQLGDDEEPLHIDKWEQTNELLEDKVKGWKQAEGRIYGENNQMSLMLC